ncbi:hypothetical protein H6F58_00685 [Glutamicibacter sp. FBE19]|nr:hypothetical protein [Glutamicibacter sp. FBE19]
MPLHPAERDATAFLVQSRRGNERRATDILLGRTILRATAKNFFREQQPITISSTSMN